MNTKDAKGPLLGIRHLQALLIFLNIVVIYMGRLNIALALVAMTDVDKGNPNFDTYDWSEKQKSYILSSFYWGYVFTQFPGGYLSSRFGAKIVMFGATFGSSLCSLIIPFCIPWGGWQAYCGIRVIQGLCQGVIFPCINDHLAKWSPVHERNRLGGFSHSGSDCGTILAMGISGVIAAGVLGWPGLSYIAAAIGFIWCALWYIFAANTAADSKLISVEERAFIETSLKQTEETHKQKIPIPWRAICSSVPFLVLLISSCAQGWSVTTMQSQIPAYLNGVLNMDIKSNAIFSALPYLAMWLLSYVYLISADILMKKKVLSLTALRKTFNTIAMWLPAACLVGIGFLDERHKTLAITLMVLNVGLNSGTTIGSLLNSIDLSPNHAGVLMGINNCLANVMPILSPLLVGVVVTDQHDRTQWQIVFLVAACIFFFGNLVYIIFGTTDVQPWNEPNFNKAINEINDQMEVELGKPIKIFDTENIESRKENKSIEKVHLT